MSALEVLSPGPLSLLQDQGRFGHAALGLSNGGPMDPIAAQLANRLLANGPDATLIEVSLGGLKLGAHTDLQIAVTGAELPLTIDNESQPLWTTLNLPRGATLALGYSQQGCRSYLAVRGGLRVSPSFGSTATVVREGIGGLAGRALMAGDLLAIHDAPRVPRVWLVPAQRPKYHPGATVRVIPGYQRRYFPRVQLERFYGSEYRVSSLSDRMGYRLEGPGIACDVTGILSEGIAPGAIQIPADGQPIVLLNDRQTIGGYPKLGSALSLDCAALAQLRPGDSVHFTPIDERTARTALARAAVVHAARRLESAPV